MKKNKAEEEAQDLRDLYKDDRTEKKIQEHLTNENDIITEEDIANAPTGIAEGKELPDSRNEDDEDDDVDDDNDDDDEETDDEDLLDKKVKPTDQPDVDTSWNVLGS